MLSVNLYKGNSSFIKFGGYDYDEKDLMVSREETESVLGQLPNAKLLLFPDFEHPIEKVNLDQLATGITKFFAID